MSYSQAMLDMEQHIDKIHEETSHVLIKIADNILKNPSVLKVRTLQKSNPTVLNKIINVEGAVNCLFIMGFVENETNFTLPISAPLDDLEFARDRISKWIEIQNKPTIAESSEASNDGENSTTSKNAQIGEEEHSTENTSPSTSLEDDPYPTGEIKQIKLPPLELLYDHYFLQQIERYFHQALVYGDKNLLARALKVIPIHKIEDQAKRRLRNLQEMIKEGKLKSSECGLQDMLILELLAWFTEFFTWVNTPPCKKCGGETKFHRMAYEPDFLLYTHRVELYICEKCDKELTPFPRYNDLNILLETRKGRCGEWANVFTLLCRAMGWDARIVFDEGDHVWTEVYSHSQKRWLHCDSCEEACDTPLMYEHGWNKKINYVMAYSHEEVQDVTWRYSSRHDEVKKRRNKVSEIDLAIVLTALRTNRQENFTASRSWYLQRRTVVELVDLMVERKPQRSEQQGRISGNDDWKRSRGEFKVMNHKWLLDQQANAKTVTIRYSPITDQYEEIVKGRLKATELKGWSAGAFDAKNVFRKEETDWKQVYLARTEGSEIGSIVWQFEVTNPKRCIDSVDVHFEHTLYETGHVRTKICSEKACALLIKDKMDFDSKEFAGEKSLKIETELSGGVGDVAWQHAQLFRQPMDSNKFPFSVTFTFKDIKP